MVLEEVIGQCLLISQGIGHFTVEVTIYSWINPASGNSGHGCCDNEITFYPQCNDLCETTLVFCLQPFQSPSSNESCPYGMFRSPYDQLISNPDNITFSVGQSLEGNVPNPMTFYVPDDLSVSHTLLLSFSLHCIIISVSFIPSIKGRSTICSQRV